MKYKNLIYSILLAISVSVLWFCAPQPCTENTLSTVKVSFYQTGTGLSVAVDSVTLYGIGMDTNKIYDKSVNLKVINIPLDAGKDSCSFFIKINQSPDTITFYYSSFTHLVSKECGFTFYHTLDSNPHWKRPEFDYQLKNINITTVGEENIRIYF